MFVGHRFRTDPDELDTLWARLPKDAERIEVVMEPTRNAWVALAAWFRRHGATVVMVPPEQSADLRDYYNKHTKTDRLDSKVLARLPLLHPEGLHREDSLGPGDELKRAVKIRSGLVHRRTACMARLDALLEILGPAWIAALGSDMTLTALRFLARYANPVQVKRLGKARLAAFFRRSSRQAWADERADAIIEAAATTLRLWGADGGELDFDALAADIAAEARLALTLTDEINGFDKRIGALYDKADPAGIVRSVPGAGRVCAPQILGRLGDPACRRGPRIFPRLPREAHERRDADPRDQGLRRARGRQSAGGRALGPSRERRGQPRRMAVRPRAQHERNPSAHWQRRRRPASHREWLMVLASALPGDDGRVGFHGGASDRCVSGP